jgi:pRiA4b ORF-3-like protein
MAELRRAPRESAAIYRVRVDLDYSEPPIWRLLDLRSDLPLDVVHQALQATFDWEDAHLHRFSLGGGPFDEEAQQFLCPFEVEDGEPGEPESAVRIDEVLGQTGDLLQYLYDYGDSWELTLRLEELLPADANSKPATLVDGERAAPPEDCGGYTDGKSLAEALEAPARFERDKINRRLRRIRTG